MGEMEGTTVVEKNVVDDVREEEEMERSESALQKNIRTKGNNAYYYAHNRSFEVPPNAIVTAGPGIITGGAPVLLESAQPPVSSDDGTNPKLPKQKVEKYLFMDDMAKCQIVMEFPLGEGEGKYKPIDDVKVFFGERSVTAQIYFPDCLKELKLPKLNGTIVVGESKHRLNKEKGKVTIVCKKESEQTWYDLLAK